MESFGRQLAKHRAALGWTQQALADRVGVSRVALAHMEAGQTIPNERTVALLAGVFGLEPPELVRGTSYPQAKADRLPRVVARHTDVDHQLALLAADLRWIEALADVPDVRAERSSVLRDWQIRLADLEAATADPQSADLIRRARRALADHRA